jgi:hypothetical protein
LFVYPPLHGSEGIQASFHVKSEMGSLSANYVRKAGLFDGTTSVKLPFCCMESFISCNAPPQVQRTGALSRQGPLYRYPQYPPSPTLYVLKSKKARAVGISLRPPIHRYVWGPSRWHFFRSSFCLTTFSLKVPHVEPLVFPADVPASKALALAHISRSCFNRSCCNF